MSGSIARKVALAAVAVLALSMSPAIAAAPKVGAACPKVNATQSVKTKTTTTTFKCVKQGKKQTWQRERTLSNDVVAWLKECRNNISVVIGYGAGGATDLWARLLASALEKETGAKFNVSNTPGAGGSLGINKVISAKRNACTIGNFNLPSGLQYLRPTSTVTYNKESMALLARTGYSANVLVVNANSSIRSTKDLIDAAKARRLNAGSDGPGSDDAIAYFDIQDKAKITFNEVVTDGSAAKVQALLNNQIDFFVGSITGVLPQVKNNQFRALCVLSDSKSSFLPDTPTCASEGLNVISANSWSMVVTNGVNERRRQAIENLILKISASADYRTANENIGVEVRPLTSDQLSEEWLRQASLYKSIINKL